MASRIKIIFIFSVLLLLATLGVIAQQADKNSETSLTKIKIILQHLSPQMVKIQVQSLLSPRGSIEIDKIKKEITVSDTQENLAKIKKLISAIDKGKNANDNTNSSAKTYMDVLPLESIRARRMITLLDEIFQQDLSGSGNTFSKGNGNKGMKLSGEVKLKALEQGNRLIIIANAEDNRRIRRAIQTIERNSSRRSGHRRLNGSGYQTRVIPLRNMQSGEAVQIINRLINESNRRGGKGNFPDYLSRGNVIVPISSSNSLLLSGDSHNLDQLQELIKEIDKPPLQVLIQVTILEVALKNSKSIGFEWSNTKQKSQMGTNFGVESQILGGSQGFYYLYGTEYFNAVLRSLQDNTDVKVLSAPHVLVTNNKKASISIGDSVVINKESLEIPTNDASTPIVRTTHAYIDVGLKFDITPQIGMDGLISMRISQDVNDIKDSGVTGFPEISKRNLDTTILVKDKESVVMGGLIKKKTSITETIVPFVGHIPIFGRLFRSTEKTIQNTELVLFVTAYIVSDRQGLQNVSNKQMKQYNDIKQRFFEKKGDAPDKQDKSTKNSNLKSDTNEKKKYN